MVSKFCIQTTQFVFQQVVEKTFTFLEHSQVFFLVLEDETNPYGTQSYFQRNVAAETLS